MKHFLAIDIGAESGRGVVVTYDGDRITLDEIHRFSNGPVQTQTGLYWDVLRIWSELKTTITLADRKYRGEIASLGVDTWGVDFALLDRNGDLVCNPRHYRDPRTEGMMEEAFKRVSKEVIYKKTGVQFMRLNTLYQLLAMVIQGSPQFEAASHLLMMPDLFNYWFCGTKVCEFTDVSTTQCFNPFENDWARDLLRDLGIPTHFLTRIVPPGTTLGPITGSLVSDLSLEGRSIGVVATSSHDTASAVAAAPLEGENDAYLSSGTWSLIGSEVRRPVVNSETLSSNFTNEGGVFSTFRLLRDIQGLWLLQECRRAWSKLGREYTYEQLSELSSRAEPFRFIVDVDDDRFSVPTDMPNAIASFCLETKQGAPKDDAEMVRCILESLALKYRMVTRMLEKILGRTIGTLNLIGGGSKNALLNQLTADATGKRVVAGPAEATSIGNGLMQCAALGLLRSSMEMRSVVRRSFELDVYEPRKENTQSWGALQEKFGSWHST